MFNSGLYSPLTSLKFTKIAQSCKEKYRKANCKKAFYKLLTEAFCILRPSGYVLEKLQSHCR